MKHFELFLAYTKLLEEQRWQEADEMARGLTPEEIEHIGREVFAAKINPNDRQRMLVFHTLIEIKLTFGGVNDSMGDVLDRMPGPIRDYFAQGVFEMRHHRLGNPIWLYHKRSAPLVFARVVDEESAVEMAVMFQGSPYRAEDIFPNAVTYN